MCFYASEEESITHLFARGIWDKIESWISSRDDIVREELRMFLVYSHLIKNLDDRLTVGLIWLAVVQNLWVIRNAIIFNGITLIFDDCYSAIL